MIYHLNRTRPYFEVIAPVFQALREGRVEAVLSVVTEIELLVKPLREHDEWEQARIKAMFDGINVQVFDLDRHRIAPMATELRASTGLDLADATIVATAIYAGCDAIVGNDERCAQRVREIPYVLLDDLVKEHQA